MNRPAPFPKRFTAAQPPPRFHTTRSDGGVFGEAIANTWHRTHGPSRIEIPIGIVAALALWPLKTDDLQLLTNLFAAQDAATWPGTVREATHAHWVRRPDLISTAAPILRWAEEEHSPDLLYAIHAVALTALKHGVLLHTGANDPAMRSGTDLMSWTITALRQRGDRAWIGEHHTPPEVTSAMNRITIGDSPPAVSSLYECAGGTGGMFRAAAQHLREHNIDPRQWTWHLQELDPVAAAGAAVNFLIWDLGPRATVACGNTLSQPDLYERSLADRAELEAIRDRLADRASTVAEHLQAVRALEALGVCAPVRRPAASSPSAA